MSTEGVTPDPAGCTVVVSLTYKNGQACEHEVRFPSEDEIWKLVETISMAMSQHNPGLFWLKEPYGIHRLEEVAAIHWANLPPWPPGTPLAQMGFVKG